MVESDIVTRQWWGVSKTGDTVRNSKSYMLFKLLLLSWQTNPFASGGAKLFDYGQYYEVYHNLSWYCIRSSKILYQRSSWACHACSMPWTKHCNRLLALGGTFHIARWCLHNVIAIPVTFGDHRLCLCDNHHYSISKQVSFSGRLLVFNVLSSSRT